MPLIFYISDEYVDLEVIDISSLVTDTCLPVAALTAESRRDIVNRSFAGFKETGFIVLEGHGLNMESISRQFDIGRLFLEVSEEEKYQYHAKIAEEGSWAGYKARVHFRLDI